MSDAFKIFIDRLREGETHKIEEDLPQEFLGPEEDELLFPEKVHAKGSAYLADQDLILHMSAHTKIKMPCSICNEMTEHDLTVDNFYHTELIQDIPGAVFDFSAPLREALIIEVPKTVECNGGKCKERDSIGPYIRSEKQTDQSTHLPFADLDKEK